MTILTQFSRGPFRRTLTQQIKVLEELQHKKSSKGWLLVALAFISAEGTIRLAWKEVWKKPQKLSMRSRQRNGREQSVDNEYLKRSAYRLEAPLRDQKEYTEWHKIKPKRMVENGISLVWGVGWMNRFVSNAEKSLCERREESWPEDLKLSEEQIMKMVQLEYFLTR